MKSKKMLLPILIWTFTILSIAACALIFMIAKKPTVTEQTFPFSITYEFMGETVYIEDVYTARFVNRGDRYRDYSGKIDSMDHEYKSMYLLQDNSKGSIVLDTQLCPNCLMGDPSYDCTHDNPMKPELIYDDIDGMRYRDEESLAEQGVRLISWEYPPPIENTFVFSHFTSLNGEVSPVMMLVGVLGLLATVVCVKKEKNVVPQPIDQVSILFHYLIGFFGVPFLALVGFFSDITGNSSNIFHQMFYFTSAFAALGVAVSIGLRRKGFSKSACIAQLVIPAIVLLLLFISALGVF